MKKMFAKRALIIMSSIFVIGLVFLFTSAKAGENAGSKAMRRNGGTINTNTYERVVNTTTLNFQIVGGILSLLGGAGILISGYETYKEI